MRKAEARSILHIEATTPDKRWRMVIQPTTQDITWIEDIANDSTYNDTEVRDLIQTQSTKNTEQDNRLTTIEGTLGNLANSGIETFPTPAGLAPGEFYYMPTPTTYAQSDPATRLTTTVRGLAWKASGGNTTGILIGTALTTQQITEITAAGSTITKSGIFYLGTDGKPTASPAFSVGYFIKKVIEQGVLVDSDPIEVGRDIKVTEVYTTTGTVAYEEYLTEKTAVANSAGAISLTIGAVPAGLDSARINFVNKGAGTLTIVTSISGTANRTVAQNATLVAEYADGAWYML